MPIDQETVRAYDPVQDPGNPLSAGPSWAKIAATAFGTVAAVLIAIQEGAVFPPDSTWAKLIAVGIKVAAAIVPALLLIHGENSKEVESVKGAAVIGEVKAKAKGDLAIAAVTGTGPAAAAPVHLGDETTTTTTTGPVQP